MQVKYDVNYKGFLSFPRALQVLLKDEDFTFGDFGMLVCFILQADFDHKHKNYGFIIRDDDVIAKEWQVSTQTVTRYRKKFIQMKLMEEVDGNTRIVDYNLFGLKNIQSTAGVPMEIYYSKYTSSTSNKIDDLSNLMSN